VKRGGYLARKTRLKPRSENGQSYLDELNAVRPVLRARSGGRCEAQLSGCLGTPTVPHHRKRRSQGGKNNLANLIDICAPCHAWVHNHPAEAMEHGLLLPRHAEVTPFMRDW
jgi:hypothetical protein